MNNCSLYEKVFLLSVLIMVSVTLYFFIKDKEFRKWLMASWEEESGRASGKSLTAFVMSALVACVVVVAVKYSDKHLIPEWMFWGLIAFVGGLYGIKVASKYTSGEPVKKEEVTPPVEQVNTPAQENPEKKEEKQKPYIEEPLV